MSKSLFVFQGGGPTAVINATLAGILDLAQGRYSKVLGWSHSLEFAGKREPLDLTPLTTPQANGQRNLLALTPGAVLGSSRARVEEPHLESALDQMLNFGADRVIGIGGNGTMSVLERMANLAQARSQDLVVAGAPKTVDNDIPGVAFAPGYGSAAKFVAMAVRDFDCDFRAMSTFDDVTILETMGRDTGWLAAASVLLKDKPEDAPHIVLIPERPVDEAELLREISELHTRLGRVFIVTNEMLTTENGSIIGEEAQDGPVDALGRTMYSLSTGTGNYLARLIWKKLGLQARCLRPGNLGRAMSSTVSQVDMDIARNVGQKAMELVEQEKAQPSMPTVDVDLSIASQTISKGTGKRPMPKEFIGSGSKFDISEEFGETARKIIGEISPIFRMQG